MTQDAPSPAPCAEEGWGEGVAAAPQPDPMPAHAASQAAAQADATEPPVAAASDTAAPVAAAEAAPSEAAATDTSHAVVGAAHATGAPVDHADAALAQVAATDTTHADVGAGDAAEAPVAAMVAARSKGPASAATHEDVGAADATGAPVIAPDAAQPAIAAATVPHGAPASPEAVTPNASSADGLAAVLAPAQEAAATPPEPDEESLRLAEALVFASAGPVSPRALTQLLPDTADADAVLAALRARYAGRGVELVDTAGGVQFRTAPELAPRLRKVIEVPRKLPRVAMETLAIIAYHQPCTRAEVEEIRGTSLSQQTLDALLEANLVAPKGRREVPGRPSLWGTTPQFLVQFGLRDIRDLPQRGDLLLETPQPSGVSTAPPITPDLSDPAPSPDEPSADP
jgi:segregation and condensation protein B